MNDKNLATDALLYLFLNDDEDSAYFGPVDVIPDVFNDLNYGQQGKFLGYYDSLRLDAVEYGHSLF